jgi:predicted metal-dependent phosphotriesterase family hydrolase
VNNPLPIEAYKQVVANLLDSGVREKDISLMIRDNPARLIGLDS